MGASETFKRRIDRALLILPLALVLAVSSRCASPKEKQGSQVRPAVELPEPYMRVQTESNIVQLQIAVRKFESRQHKGPVIWLVGVSHIGSTNYYQTLQTLLNRQSLVLFEGVGEHDGTKFGRRKENVQRAPDPEPTNSAPEGYSLQSSLAHSLGLAFQLEAIDYDRPNFRNSDLTIPEIQKLMSGERRPADSHSQARQEGGQSPDAFEGLLQIMDGSSFLGTIAQAAVKFLGSSPRLQAITKLAFAEILGEVKGDISQVRGLPPDMKHLIEVLIQSRNEKVVGDLKEAVKKAGRQSSIAVFYGAGHMPDMESRVRRILDYVPIDQLWLSAISVDPRQSGLSEMEIETVKSVVKWQLQALKPQPVDLPGQAPMP